MILADGKARCPFLRHRICISDGVAGLMSAAARVMTASRHVRIGDAPAGAVADRWKVTHEIGE